MKRIPVDATEVRVCKDLFGFLQERRNERYTKFEAYCDLLNKASVQYISSSIPKGDRPELAEFHFVTTKTELAEVWHWHRATVRAFLDKLDEYGEIVRQEEPKCIICRMTALESSQKPTDLQLQLFDDMAAFIVTAWSSGNVDINQTAITCGQIITSSVKLSNQIMPLVNKEYTSFLHDSIITRLIQRLIDSTFSLKDNTTSSESMRDLLVEAFTIHLHEDWERMLHLMMDIPKLAAGKRSVIDYCDNEQFAVHLQAIFTEYRNVYEIPVLTGDEQQSVTSNRSTHK